MRLKTLIVTTLLVAVLSTGLFAGETGENSSNGNNAYQHGLTLEQEVHRELSRIKVKPTDKMRLEIASNIVFTYPKIIYFKGQKFVFKDTYKQIGLFFKAAFEEKFNYVKYIYNLSDIALVSKISAYIKKLIKNFNVVIEKSNEARERVSKVFREILIEKVRLQVKRRRKLREIYHENKTLVSSLINIKKTDKMKLVKISALGTTSYKIIFKKFEAKFFELADYEKEKRYQFLKMVKSVLKDDFNEEEFNEIFIQDEYLSRIHKIKIYLDKLTGKFNNAVYNSTEAREQLSKVYGVIVFDDIENIVQYKKYEKSGKKLISLYLCVDGGGNNANPRPTEGGFEIEGSLRFVFYLSNPASNINYGLIFEPYLFRSWNNRIGANLLFSLKVPVKKYSPSNIHLALGFSAMYLLGDGTVSDKTRDDYDINSYNKFIPMVVFEAGYLYQKPGSLITFFFTFAVKYGFKPLVKDFTAGSFYDKPGGYFAFIIKGGFGFNL